MHVRFPGPGCLALLAVPTLFIGCAAPPPLTPDPVEVVVSPPVERDVVAHFDFTGRTRAKESVELRARVGGYLDKINFKDGAEVKEGQVLFVIDDRTIKAERDQAKAQVDLFDAQVKAAEAEKNRNTVLRRSGTATQEELEKSLRSWESSQASADASRAELRQKQLNLDYCQVIAPISGQADRANVTVGNLVSADTSHATVLTTIVTLAPMYVYFSVDEPTLLHLQQQVRAGKLKDKLPDILVGVGGGDTYPFRGAIDFMANQIDAATGTLEVRGNLPNKDHILKPGLFACIRVPIGDPHPALLVSETALATSQGQKYVYVVDDQDKVVYRPVTVGPMSDGLWIIEDGLKAGERVIIEGTLRVRPGITVKPKAGDMVPKPVPTLTRQ